MKALIHDEDNLFESLKAIGTELYERGEKDHKVALRAVAIFKSETEIGNKIRDKIFEILTTYFYGATYTEVEKKDILKHIDYLHDEAMKDPVYLKEHNTIGELMRDQRLLVAVMQGVNFTFEEFENSSKSLDDFIKDKDHFCKCGRCDPEDKEVQFLAGIQEAALRKEFEGGGLTVTFVKENILDPVRATLVPKDPIEGLIKVLQNLKKEFDEKADNTKNDSEE